jgi:hypothetical protein
MTRRGQYACVLAGLLICLTLTLGFVGSPQPARKAQPAGGDDIPFPTWDVPTWNAKTSSPRPRVPASMVPEGVAVLLVTVIWTACRALLSGRLEYHPMRRVLTMLIYSRASAGGAPAPPRSAARTTRGRRSFG